MSDGRVVVETRKLVKTYKLGDNVVHALRGVNLKIMEGEAVAIMGPSGSGKTTLLNMLGAMDTPTSGEVIIDGVNISGMSDKQLTLIRRHMIGPIFQFYNLIPVLTAFENVELPMIFAGFPKDVRGARAKQLLTAVGLGNRINHRPDELSGGEQQRVAIARALANNPAIILGDEVTGDLDTKTGEEIVRMLLKLSKEEKRTLIIVTHDPNVGAKMDRILRIRDGQITTEEN
ncbi:MAG: ABC transporter ATP-binding protein [Promethearchaeati archaeon SRVP18_Atabeyarchaeia-1]